VGLTTDKGEIGEAEVIADLRRRGHGVAIPFGHSLPFDLVLVRGDTGALERVQVKYTTSDGRVVMVRCRSQSAWVSYQYRPDLVDWIATFDATTRSISYVHSCEWGGWTSISLRLTPTTNGQAIGVRWARDFLEPECRRCNGSSSPSDDERQNASRRGDLNP
jgi:hypothetical protein